MNMLAVKEALHTPEPIFAALVLVDTIVAYTWMGGLLFLSPRQKSIDAWFRADPRILEWMRQTAQKIQNASSETIPSLYQLAQQIALPLLVTALSLFLSQHLPTRGAVLTPATWTLLGVTSFSLLLSLTPLRNLENSGSSRLGYLLLYLLLASIGARANMAYLLRYPAFLLLGTLCVLFHGLLLVLYGKITKTPLFFLASASQANVGGAVSAPIVAAVYQPGLASVGLLLAILGNALGTYLGIFSGAVARILAGWLFSIKI